ncbi:M48 family metallopeptidase [Anaerohalosphaera lusitana]|nr:YgjP-like metallopeptidase domain-containing protein [Anaerohalosphaera lusitana]
MAKNPERRIEYEGLGEVLFAKHRRARRLSISVRPFKGVRVTVPWRVSFAAAVRFFEEHRSWAAKSCAKMARVEAEQRAAVAELPVIDRAEARRVLVGRLAKLAGMYRFSYNRVFVRNQKTRWGSCSGKNNINLNVNLVRLRQELIDYVLLHELVHTRVKNHSARFWRELDKYVGDAKYLDRCLRDEGIPRVD